MTDQETLKVPDKVFNDLTEGARGALTDDVLRDAAEADDHQAAQAVILLALISLFKAEATERLKLAITIHELNKRAMEAERERDRYREALLNLSDELNRLGGRVHHESRQEYGYQL